MHYYTCRLIQFQIQLSKKASSFPDLKVKFLQLKWSSVQYTVIIMTRLLSFGNQKKMVFSASSIFYCIGQIRRREIKSKHENWAEMIWNRVITIFVHHATASHSWSNNYVFKRHYNRGRLLNLDLPNKKHITSSIDQNWAQYTCSLL